jgi:hypothetical protein
LAYLLNPKYNLRLELGGIYRTEKNSDFNDKTAMITFGLRSSFRQIYTIWPATKRTNKILTA